MPKIYHAKPSKRTRARVQYEKTRDAAVREYMDAMAVQKDAPEKKVKHVYQSN